MNRFSAMSGAWLVVLTAMSASGGALAQSGSENTIQGFEATEVNLTVGSGNRILEVRVKGCELCTKTSYLPARDIVITRGDQGVPASDYQLISGNSGTIMFDERNDMVFKVNYWPSRGEGDVR